MDLDSLGSESEYDEKDWDAIESGWYHLHGRWLRTGLPERITFAGLLRAIGEEAYGTGEGPPRVDIRPPRSLIRHRETELGLLPQGPPAVRNLRNTRIRGWTPEETGETGQDTNGGETRRDETSN